MTWQLIDAEQPSILSVVDCASHALSSVLYSSSNSSVRSTCGAFQIFEHLVLNFETVSISMALQPLYMNAVVILNNHRHLIRVTSSLHSLVFGAAHRTCRCKVVQRITARLLNRIVAICGNIGCVDATQLAWASQSDATTMHSAIEVKIDLLQLLEVLWNSTFAATCTKVVRVWVRWAHTLQLGRDCSICWSGLCLCLVLERLTYIK